MDVEVDITNVLPGQHRALENAAIWIREHFNIPEDETIFEKFEENFNCQIEVDDRNDYWMQPNKVVFKNNKDLIAFLLKWS